MECMIVMLLICVNSVYEKKSYLDEEPTDPHVVYHRFPFLLLNNTYGNKDKMGDEVSEIWR